MLRQVPALLAWHHVKPYALGGASFILCYNDSEVITGRHTHPSKSGPCHLSQNSDNSEHVFWGYSMTGLLDDGVTR